MRKKILPILLSFVLVFSFTRIQAQTFVDFLGSRPDVSGDQFLAGSQAVDAVSYAKFLLSGHEGTDIDAKWFPATFLIRPTDAYGVLLTGPSADGLEDGSVSRVKFGYTLVREKFSAFISTDLFMAQAKSGFATRAGQILPGVEYRLKDKNLAFRAGWIFKFSDPIDESGLFLSRYTGKGGFEGRYDRGDYGLYAPMPEGVAGFKSREPFLSVLYKDFELNSLLSGDGLALMQLLRVFEFKNSVVKYIAPALSYVGKNYHNYGDEDITRFTQANAFQFGKVKIMPMFDLGIVPFAVYQLRANVNFNGFEIGSSLINIVNRDGDKESLTGFRAGYYREFNKYFTIGLLWSKNYSDYVSANLSARNAVMTEFALRLNIFAPMYRNEF